MDLRQERRNHHHPPLALEGFGMLMITVKGLPSQLKQVKSHRESEWANITPGLVLEFVSLALKLYIA